MRRAASSVLIILGALVIIFAPFLRFVIYPSLTAIPTDIAETTVSIGRRVSMFDQQTYQVHREELRTVTRVTGRPDALESGGDVAVWDVNIVTEYADGRPVSTTNHRMCLDRRTNETQQECPSQHVDGDTAVKHSGLGYKFPFGTKRQNYPYFDIVTRTSEPMRFVAEERFDDLPVYRFEQRIPPTRIKDEPVPGALVGGAPGSTVIFGRYYENTRTAWVEPYTGTVVEQYDVVRQVLRAPDGREMAVLLNGKFTFDRETSQRLLRSAKDGRTAMRAASVFGPIGLAILGVVLVGTGLLVLTRRPRRRAASDSEPVLSPHPPA